MGNPNEDGPISPMKKLKILGEKQNVQPRIELAPLESIKESLITKTDLIENKYQQNIEIVQEEKEDKLDVEPLLEDNPNQYVIFPINHDDMWQMYKHLVDNFWSVTESLQQLDALGLTYDEIQLMKYFSSIFGSPQSQGLVNENFAEEFCKVIQVTEAKFFYGHQLFVQNIHFEMYNKLLDKFAATFEEKEKLFKIVENFDAVANKRSWVAQWKHRSFGEQIMASACLHGLMFSSLELVNDWLKGKKKGGFTHELFEIFDRMILDQELQRDFSCLMISHLKQKPNKEEILNAINDAAKLEFDFLINGLKSDIVGIEADDIILLIDRKTKELKHKIFNSLIGNVKTINTNALGDANKAQTKFNEENNMPKENIQKLVLDEDF